MWSDRRQEDSSRADVGSAGKSEAGARDLGLSRSLVQVGSVALVGRGMLIRGHIRSGEHIHVDGEVDGTVQLPGFDLTVSKNARVRADVQAREVEVSGVIDGNVEASRKITVRKGGRLLGDLRTPGIVIEDGAYFKGKIEITNGGSDNRENGASRDAGRKVAATY
jgi:cytoskeletal protein CcmA (bactofilin family)